MTLTKEQIKYFIENYGNDDVYFDHHYEGANNQFLIVEFYQHLGKMVSPENIEQAKLDLAKRKIMPNIIVITKNGARIVSSDKKISLKDKTNVDQMLEKQYQEQEKTK